MYGLCFSIGLSAHAHGTTISVPASEHVVTCSYELRVTRITSIVLPASNHMPVQNEEAPYTYTPLCGCSQVVEH